MPKNHKCMPKIARKTPNLAYTPIFGLFFSPNRPEAYFPPPPARPEIEVYTSPIRSDPEHPVLVINKKCTRNIDRNADARANILE